jgi:hypothetical protein
MIPVAPLRPVQIHNVFNIPTAHEFSCLCWELQSNSQQLYVSGGGESFHGSHRMGEGRIFRKISAPLSLINIYRMNLISAGSISLDSTFKLRNELSADYRYSLQDETKSQIY